MCEELNRRIRALDKYIDDNRTTIKANKIIEFHFPDNYECEQDDMLRMVNDIHLKYVEIIKHNIMNKGYDVKQVNYIDDYINYADCYTSKCVYHIV